MLPEISLENVNHAFRSGDTALPVLDGVSITCETGSFTAVVGPSGCGKSTLTRLISGLLIPDEGTVMLEGAPVRSPRASVGMAFQNPVLLEWRTILDNVLLPLEIVANDLTRQQRRDRAKALLHLVGLDGFEDKRPSQLSGGMRQRASLCRALVHRPKVLILDEPFGALDAFTREDLWQVMTDLRKEEAFTCLLITHDLRESVFLADKIVVLSARPARVQQVVDVGLGQDREIDMLYQPEAVAMLAELRHQIQIAQGRA
ncbi:MAG: ABC transporter ATP-binding protein [Pseudomonadota bacterium]